MIEVIYKDEKQDAKGGEEVFSIPRNIRQIGLIGGDNRIYMEDYVYTFLVRLSGREAEKEKENGALAVLTGETRWKEGISYLFIKGALLAEGTETALDHIDFSGQVWEKIHEEQKAYFPEQEIVGWFFSCSQLPMEATELFTKIHLRDFGGEKVLMLMEPGEREEAFFRYENGSMVRQRGYYIYYEKNPLMQEYMIQKKERLRQEPKEVIEDEAVKSFRKIIRGKKEGNSREKAKPEGEGEPSSLFSYVATACMLIAVLAVGASFYRNYQMLRETQGQEAASMSVEEEILETPTVIPKPTKDLEEAELTPTPLPQAEKEEIQTISDLTKGEESSQLYREESDARKAKRREELAKRESQEAEGGQKENDEEGQVIQGEIGETAMPQITPSPAVSAQETASASSLTEGQVRERYVIRPGDTLYQISVAKYGSMDQIALICQLNGLTENQTIYPGQVIVLP